MLSLQKKYTEEVRKIGLREENKGCIVCGSKSNYICLKYGIFICETCSGIFRHYGEVVKGISVSNFSKDEVEYLNQFGNKQAEDALFPKNQKGFMKPDPGNTFALGSFIQRYFIESQSNYKPQYSFDKNQLVEQQKAMEQKYYDQKNQSNLSLGMPFDQPISEKIMPKDAKIRKPIVDTETSSTSPKSNLSGKDFFSFAGKSQQPSISSSGLKKPQQTNAPSLLLSLDEIVPNSAPASSSNPTLSINQARTALKQQNLQNQQNQPKKADVLSLFDEPQNTMELPKFEENPFLTPSHFGLQQNPFSPASPTITPAPLFPSVMNPSMSGMQNMQQQYNPMQMNMQQQQFNPMQMSNMNMNMNMRSGMQSTMSGNPMQMQMNMPQQPFQNYGNQNTMQMSMPTQQQSFGQFPMNPAQNYGQSSMQMPMQQPTQNPNLFKDFGLNESKNWANTSTSSNFGNVQPIPQNISPKNTTFGVGAPAALTPPASVQKTTKPTFGNQQQPGILSANIGGNGLETNTTKISEKEADNFSWEKNWHTSGSKMKDIQSKKSELDDKFTMIREENFRPFAGKQFKK